MAEDHFLPSMIRQRLRDGYVYLDDLKFNGDTGWGFVIDSEAKDIKMGDRVLFERVQGSYTENEDCYIDAKYVIAVKKVELTKPKGHNSPKAVRKNK